ncbi:hypothetical protein PPYR_11238 [Photinus pyralis]|uniref:Cytochrome c oxidase assembly protein COX20, mitochondrial n=1 Tax=Photinus pyralis TaxID=7054 RepID=A0A1Y1N9S0_PHOPY|nr:hypothetical protein PPYR_11238 [Photinus pyralis]
MKEISSDSSIVIFGKDVSKIPCFRNSFLYGISGGLACGLLRFMFTSKPQSGANFAVGAYGVIALCYWIQCRYKFSEAKLEMQRTRYLLQQHSLLQGTEADNDNNDVGHDTKEV